MDKIILGMALLGHHSLLIPGVVIAISIRITSSMGVLVPGADPGFQEGGSTSVVKLCARKIFGCDPNHAP